MIFSNSFKMVVIICIVPILVFAAVKKMEFNERLPILGTKPALDLKIYKEQFRDHKGNKKSFDNYRGKIMLINFFFTSCPSICLTMTQNLTSAAKKFEMDATVRMLSFTVDPVRDSSERLSHYAKRFNADFKQWDFLTGEKSVIYRIARQNFHVTATEGDGGPNDFIHTDKVILIDQNGFIRGYYEGTSKEAIDELIKDVIRLKHENI